MWRLIAPRRLSAPRRSVPGEPSNPPAEARALPELPAAVDEKPLFALCDLGWADDLGVRTDFRPEDSFR